VTYLLNMSILQQEETDILLGYFDISLCWVGNVPKIKLVLKDYIKSGKSIPYKKIDGKKGKQPFTPANYEYYKHYFDNMDESGLKEIYNIRKKLYSMYNLIPWYLENINYDERLVEYYDLLKFNNSKSLKLHYSSEAGIQTKEKLKKRNEMWKYYTAEVNKSLWKNDDWKSREMSRRDNTHFYETVSDKLKEYHRNPNNREKIDRILKSPQRIEKIRKASKQMWDDAKKNNHELYYRMCNSAKNKSYEICGIHMNSIEYRVAKILIDMGVEWEYEKIFNIETRTYLPDFFIESKNLIIECYGDFWHANPLFFKETHYTHKNVFAKNIWDRDNRRKSDFIKSNYKFLELWESDINDNMEYIKGKIYEYIK
jgi:G:T-mismatch repair DNA endonuclease (very short patch repair protein)